jgi:O-antigen/teichoic acid export membrane protein
MKGYLNRFFNNDLLYRSARTFVLQVGGVGLSYLMILIISRFYGVEILGLFSLAIVILNISSMLILSGLDTSAIKFIPGLLSSGDLKGVNSFYWKSLLHILIAGTIISVICYFGSYYIAVELMHKQELIVYIKEVSVIILPFSIISFIAESIRANNNTVWWSVLKQIIIPFSFLCLTLIAWRFFPSLPNPIAMYSFGVSISLLLAIVGFIVINNKANVPISMLVFDHEPQYKTIRKIATPMFMFSSTLQLSQWINTIMLGILGTAGDNGIFRVVERVSSVNILVLVAVNAVLAPKIAATYAMNDLKTLHKHVQQATKFIFWGSLPIQILLLIFCNPILDFFGADFGKGSTAIYIVIVGQLINSMSGPVGQILNMTSYQKYLRNISALGVLTTTVSSYFLISYFGINGAAMTLLINSLLINLLCIFKIKKVFKFWALYIPFYKPNIKNEI